MFMNLGAAFAFTALLYAAKCASADPLAYLFLQGRVAGTEDPFTSNLSVAPGQTLEYRVVGQLAPIGTVNSNFGGNRPFVINSISKARPEDHPGNSTLFIFDDGIGAIGLDIFQDPDDPVQLDIQIPTLNPDPLPDVENDGWNKSFSGRPRKFPRPGHPEVHDILAIHAIHSAGVQTAREPEVILWGTATVPADASGTSGSVRLRFTLDANTNSGFLRINGTGDRIFITPQSESSPDPLLAIDPPMSAPDPVFSMAAALSDDSLIERSRLQINLIPEPISLMPLLLTMASLRRVSRPNRQTPLAS